jgi:transcriptional regulator with XRE-family HTH domain
MAGGRAIVVDMNDIAVLQRPSLRERRLAARVTLQALAERAGVSYSMVQILDRGYQPGHSDVRAKVLVALGELEDDGPLEAA